MSRRLLKATLLGATGVSKAFPGVKALDDVHFDLRYGEVLALVGENGAGKSTLMKLLAGIETPDSGEFRLAGESFQPRGPRHAQEMGISIIHQELSLMPDLTVAQNIFIGREQAAGGFVLNERALNRRATELFRQLGIDLEATERVERLTIAHQQMVEIARALSYQARVLIMDEPTSALNDAEVETLFGLIRRFKSPETGVIFISHRMDELPRIADRVEVLRDGRNVGTRDMAATTPREIISLMVGRYFSQDDARVPRPPSGEPVLTVTELSTKSLLRDVSFDLHAGEILGFAGLLGAGRTEVARAVVGADPRSSGMIHVHGKPVDIKTPAHAATLGIGYLTEDRKQLGLLLDQSVRDNIVLATIPRFSPGGLPRFAEMASIATEFIGRLRIKTPSTAQEARNLSGGNQQKVAIAKWLVKDCDVLIFDEPTRGIDVGAKEEIYALLDDLAAQGKAIIMISSELPEVLRLSDRVVVMAQGRVTGILPRSEATQERIMHLATDFSDERTVRS
ncbi:MAG TPA: sugar ABC transporter ATP-binding protein [Pseudolysinimonas sp.]